MNYHYDAVGALAQQSTKPKYVRKLYPTLPLEVVWAFLSNEFKVFCQFDLVWRHVIFVLDCTVAEEVLIVTQAVVVLAETSEEPRWPIQHLTTMHIRRFTKTIKRTPQRKLRVLGDLPHVDDTACLVSGWHVLLVIYASKESIIMLLVAKY